MIEFSRITGVSAASPLLARQQEVNLLSPFNRDALRKNAALELEQRKFEETIRQAKVDEEQRLIQLGLTRRGQDQAHRSDLLNSGIRVLGQGIDLISERRRQKEIERKNKEAEDFRREEVLRKKEERAEDLEREDRERKEDLEREDKEIAATREDRDRTYNERIRSNKEDERLAQERIELQRESDRLDSERDKLRDQESRRSNRASEEDRDLDREQRDREILLSGKKSDSSSSSNTGVFSIPATKEDRKSGKATDYKLDPITPLAGDPERRASGDLFRERLFKNWTLMDKSDLPEAFLSNETGIPSLIRMATNPNASEEDRKYALIKLQSFGLIKDPRDKGFKERLEGFIKSFEIEKPSSYSSSF